MSDLSLNRRSLAALGFLAANTGDEALQARVEELRGLANAAVTESPDKLLVAKLASTWAGVYGDDRAPWPKGLRDAIENIGAGIGFSSFGNNLTAALQNLRLTDETYPAFEAGVAVVAPFMGPNSPMNRATTNGLIPEGAARAGLHFMSSPVALIIPIWSAGLFGRAAMGGVSAFGRFLGIANESATALSIAASVPVEAAAFMGTSRVTQYVAQDSFAPPNGGVSPATSIGRAEALRYTVEEFAASTFFFGGLKLFGWAGTVAQSVLPLTETGMAAARGVAHATSIVGLAATEQLQPAVVAPFMGPDSPMNRATTFYESLWRAAFLHGTVSAVGGLVGDFSVAESKNSQIILQARVFIESLRRNAFVTEGATMSGIKGIKGDDLPVPNHFAFAGKGTKTPEERSWMEHYFGPDYVNLHPVYKPNADKDAKEVDFIIEIASQLVTGKSVLDLCCGYGRHAIELARRGFQVIGIDKSRHMLGLARENASGVETVTFEERDMREIDHSGRFDLALSMFSSFGFFPADIENERVIQGIARSLSRDGIFILDIINRVNAVKWIGAHPYQESIIENGRLKLVEECEFDVATNILKGTNRTFDAQSGKLRTEGTFWLRLYSLEEIQQLLQKYGLEVVRLLGNLNVNEPFSDTSPRMVIVSRKTAP